MRLIVHPGSPSTAASAEKHALLDAYLGSTGTPVHAGLLPAIERAVQPGEIVVEDAVDGLKPKLLRASLDALERRGVLLRSAAQVLSAVGAVVPGLGAGDTTLHCGLLPDDTWEEALAEVRDEVQWLDLYHRGGLVPRTVSVQALLDGGREPVYRHPVDDHPTTVPFTPAVERLRQRTSALLGQTLNHALVQRYVDGDANISLHADKTLDVARGSAVVNVSLGATRTMVLRSKIDHQTQRIDLPHGSVFSMGWETNRRFQHGILPDRRTPIERRRDERRGERISLTFRTVATFRVEGVLVGQGAGPRTDRKGLLDAFGEENRDPSFDWDRWYGEGWSL